MSIYQTCQATLLGALTLALAACTNSTVQNAPAGGNMADSPATAQAATPATDSPLVQRTEPRMLYIRAIEDYITAVYQKDQHRFDTLYFGKHSYGQPDDFPDITLPATIQGTHILLLSNEESDKLKFGNTSAYINMVGSVGNLSEFVLVTFAPGFRHTFDGFVNYTYNPALREYGPADVRIEDYIFSSEGKLQRIAIYKGGKYTGDKALE